MKRVHVRVAGRVQGVFFRESTRSEAKRRGVSGWVKNLPDGSVEATFEGEPPAVEGLVDWCRSGPARARVEEFQVREEEARGDLEGFVVVR